MPQDQVQQVNQTTAQQGNKTRKRKPTPTMNGARSSTNNSTSKTITKEKTLSSQVNNDNTWQNSIQHKSL